VTLSLSAAVVVAILRGRQPHYRQFLEDAIEAGEDVRLCSLVLHQLAHAALNGKRPEPHLDQLAALVGYVEVEPWTGEDAMSAARLRLEWERSSYASRGSRVGLLDVLAAGQAQNRGWALVVDRPDAWTGGAMILWGDPAGPVDLRNPARKFVTGR
jgi:predicted nucleic acid-binding protein